MHYCWTLRWTSSTGLSPDFDLTGVEFRIDQEKIKVRWAQRVVMVPDGEGYFVDAAVLRGGEQDLQDAQDPGEPQEDEEE